MIKASLITVCLLLLAPVLARADEESDRIQAIEIGRRSVVSLRVYRENPASPEIEDADEVFQGTSPTQPR